MTGSALRVVAGVCLVIALFALFQGAASLFGWIGAQNRTLEAERMAAYQTTEKPGTDAFDRAAQHGKYAPSSLFPLFNRCRDAVRSELGAANIEQFDGGAMPETDLLVTWSDRGRTYAGVSKAGSRVIGRGEFPLEPPVEGRIIVQVGVDLRPRAGGQAHRQYMCDMVSSGTSARVKSVWRHHTW